MITHPEESSRLGASLCVITKPRERGGHSPRWAAEPEKTNKHVQRKLNFRDTEILGLFYFTLKKLTFLLLYNTPHPTPPHPTLKLMQTLQSVPELSSKK
jgi:hypothetical protein